MVQPAPEVYNFPVEEEAILQYWKEINAFQECLKQSKGKPPFSFYDGPPFATGLPHYGHLLAGSIKDVVTRYAHQNGYHVERRFGWDCHGLPVEYEIDKTLGIKGPEDVAKMGIDKYNKECRDIVMRYADEWETIVSRLGRWIDFKNDYKTLYPWFMESVWWVFSELWNKGLVYRGTKVMPFSTACSTPLSNFESGQNYKDVVDPAVVVTFPLVEEPSVELLAWTTTPWTLPSNLALCLHPDLCYVRVQDKTSQKLYIVMEARLSSLFKSEEDYIILEKFNGAKLKGLKYVPLFSYFGHIKTAFVVLNDGYVTEESGTGVVHQAPYFGEDDNRVCLAAGVITKDQEPVCPVDEGGRFLPPVQDFAGVYVKEADKMIIAYLKKQGRLFSVGTVKHSYPFCWRSETPLIYKAVPSWFVRVQQMSEDLLRTNRETYWVPDFVKEKRFGNWLRDARDWAVSRNRYWGTPIPLWVSPDLEEVVCVGSISQLEALTGVRVTDLHRESIDHLKIPSCRPGAPPLSRVPEVFDCWFESGSMPYAQLHFPFENSREFQARFPADFIAEGIDQTRGWFYTLLVVSTALFNKPPFKNLIAHGLVLAADGQKMSKRKKNYPDPMEVVNKYGADALRLYLINSPVVRAENLRFKEEGVRDILKDALLPWYNAYRFLLQNVARVKKEEGDDFKFEETALTPSNLMDRWILSFTESLQEFVHKEMGAYRLYTVLPRLVHFIENLTNWYVRMNRRRIKGEGGQEDCRQAMATLGSVLLSMARLMAPYTPFLTEHMFQNLKLLAGRPERSVHFVQMPRPRTDLIDTEIEISVSRMQTVIELGRIIRDRKTLPIKYPLREAVVILDKQSELEALKPFQTYITQELNVKTVTLSSDKESFGVSLSAEPDHKTLGARLKGQFKAVMQAIKDLGDHELRQLQSEGRLEVLGHTLGPEDVRMKLSFAGPRAAELARTYEPHSEGAVLVLLDITPDESMRSEGVAREIINRVQKLRKKAHLVPTDDIKVYYQVSPESSDLARVATDFHSFIETNLKAQFKDGPAPSGALISEQMDLKGASLTLAIERLSEEIAPFCRYLNVALLGLDRPQESMIGSVLLENPIGQNFLTHDSLIEEIQILFGLQGRQITLKTLEGGDLPKDLLSLTQKTILAVPKNYKEKLISQNFGPQIVTRFSNLSFNSQKAVVLLENPVSNVLEFNEERLKSFVKRIFSLSDKNVTLSKPTNSLIHIS